jgi:hypothetical protein
LIVQYSSLKPSLNVIYFVWLVRVVYNGCCWPLWTLSIRPSTWLSHIFLISCCFTFNTDKVIVTSICSALLCFPILFFLSLGKLWRTWYHWLSELCEWTKGVQKSGANMLDPRSVRWQHFPYCWTSADQGELSRDLPESSRMPMVHPLSLEVNLWSGLNFTHLISKWKLQKVRPFYKCIVK